MNRLNALYCLALLIAISGCGRLTNDDVGIVCSFDYSDRQVTVANATAEYLRKHDIGAYLATEHGVHVCVPVDQVARAKVVLSDETFKEYLDNYGSAQQGDAPEPATNANPASRTSPAPAR